MARRSLASALLLLMLLVGAAGVSGSLNCVHHFALGGQGCATVCADHAGVQQVSCLRAPCPVLCLVNRSFAGSIEVSEAGATVCRPQYAVGIVAVGTPDYECCCNAA